MLLTALHIVLYWFFLMQSHVIKVFLILYLAFIVPENNNLSLINSTEPNETELLRASQFGQLFEADKKRLYAYIHAFVSDHTVAEDIFQETSLIMWQEFDKFELGSKFSKWTNVIAFYRIAQYRNTNKKYQLGLSDDFLQEFSQNISIIENNTHTQEQKWQHLEHCCTLLSEPLRNVYQSFYIDNLTAQQIATNTGRSLIAIRKVVHKVRKKLFDCIEQKKQGTSL